MSFLGLLNKAFKAQRRSDVLLASTTIAASHTLTRAAGGTCCMLVTIAGADVTGTIKLVGLVAGVSTSETLTFSGAGSRQSKNQFDAGQLTSIEPSGLTGTLAVAARAPSGQPLVQNVDLTGNFAGRLSDARYRLKQGIAGQDENVTHILFMSPLSTTLQGGDRILDVGDSIGYLVSASLKRSSQAPGAHHWEIPVITED